MIENLEATNPRQRIYGKHYGNWRIWQEQKNADGVIMPVERYERFNQFIVENAPPIVSSEYHLHCFYDAKVSKTYWKLTGSSVVCKVPGRCKKVDVMLKDSDA